VAPPTCHGSGGARYPYCAGYRFPQCGARLTIQIKGNGRSSVCNLIGFNSICLPPRSKQPSAASVVDRSRLAGVDGKAVAAANPSNSWPTVSVWGTSSRGPFDGSQTSSRSLTDVIHQGHCQLLLSVKVLQTRRDLDPWVISADLSYRFRASSFLGGH
jgi:hypothetical protein